MPEVTTDPLRVHRFADAGAFLDAAEPWLLEDEAANNLILGIAAGARDGARTYDAPLYFATAVRDGKIVGCAFRTPPHKVGLTAMPADAAAAMARDVAEVYDAVPSVLGPAEAARAFADAWSARAGGAWRIAMRNGIYRLDSVASGLPPVTGALTVATRDDLDTIGRWADAFAVDTGIAIPRESLRERVDAGEFVLWAVDGRPVSMAAATGPTPHGVRIGYVYTPPERRGRGYATACVAAFSARMLAAGRRFCFLYTDLANPTSNAIYARIGYRPVCEVEDIVFEPVKEPSAQG